MTAPEDWLTPYRLRALRIGMWTSLLIVASLIAFLLLGGTRQVALVPFVVVLGVSLVAIPGSSLLPWPRLFESGRALPIMYASAMAGAVLMALLVFFGHTAGSDLFFLYAFTFPFWAASLPKRAQVGLVAFAVATYVVVLAIEGWPVPVPNLALRLGLFAALAYSTRFLSDELRAEVSARHLKQREAERHSRQLAAVARAARTVNTLDGENVLEGVVDCAIDLGFDAATLIVYSDDLEAYAVSHAHGLPEEYARDVHSARLGMAGVLRDGRRAAVVQDYERLPSPLPMIRELGFRGVIGAPIFVNGRLVAALIAGTREDRRVTRQDVEAIELLAALAGRALENAEQFAAEQRAVARLAEVDRMKGEFITTVSHELRTPLTAVLGMGLTLERQWEAMEEPMRREFLQRLNANAAALEDIVRTLLDFSRIDAERVEMHRGPVRIEELVRSLVDRMRPLLERHRLDLDLDDVLVDADAGLLERILENLLTNAAKHTPNGTTIAVATRIEGSSVEVAVTDSGPGIPAGDLRHLADRFFRGGEANTRRTRGSGLGLALVKEILELHGSTLEVTSDRGRGSTFSFRLPLSVEGSRPGPRTTSATPRSA